MYTREEYIEAYLKNRRNILQLYPDTIWALTEIYLFITNIILQLIGFLTSNVYMLDKNLNSLKINKLLFSFFFMWIFEWLYIFEYCMSYYSFMYILFPYRLPLFLLICFICFIYIWGISVWRRTQSGKFTRGDRKLWSKGFASFWFVEFTTVLGLVIAAAWMNWGPTPIFPRTFYVTRKSFLIEVTFFTYILWLLYLMRFSIKWSKWKEQLFLTSLVLILISYLIWRDILIIYGRENITLQNSCRWRYISTSSLIYMLYPEWWMTHFINQKQTTDLKSLFFNLNEVLQNINSIEINDIFNKEISLNEYERYNFLPIINLGEWYDQSLIQSSNFEWLVNWINEYYDIEINLEIYHIFNFMEDSLILNRKNYEKDFSLDSYTYYPRKIGYQPKKIAMWTFFFFLKIWHHLMLFIWWFMYLIRLYSKKKNSYSWLSICHFNIYCCFLISFVIFIFSYFPWFEMFFRLFKKKNTMQYTFKFFVRFHWGVDYIYSIIKEIFEQKIYSSSNLSIFKKNYWELYYYTIFVERNDRKKFGLARYYFWWDWKDYHRELRSTLWCLNH